MRYAAQTGVPVDRSKSEIERLLARYGASRFAHGWDLDKAVVMFHAHGRMIRFTLPLPARKEFGTTPTGRARKNPRATDQAWEQACRQRWRALSLVIKAKLEAVESRIAEFETEFLAYVVLPTGGTVGEWVKPQIHEAYATGRLPKMLPGLGETS
jgi:hypothetical protein